ncbi:glycosyltransferase [Cyclobacterium xiamenense]|uniref:glycosyltransferase n=1 Tax=Cyclobacterium xiamenense TaxID=1297121 RepID=UPI0012B8A441|nr:glycosyltransferase [Cyclobacterium xiamenense]
MKKRKILVLLAATEMPWLIDAVHDALRSLDKRVFAVQVYVLQFHPQESISRCSEEEGLSWNVLRVNSWLFQLARWFHHVTGLPFLLRYLGGGIQGTYSVGMGINGGNRMDLLYYNAARIDKRMLWLHADLQSFAWFRQRVAGENSEITPFERRLDKTDWLLAGSSQVYRAIGKGLERMQDLRLVYPPVDRYRVQSRSERSTIVRMDSHVFNMVAVGPLSPVQGFDLLLTALTLVKRNYPRFHLYLVGEGKLLDFLRLHCLDEGLSDYVSFLRKVANYQALIKRADLFVNSSYTESYPIPLIEALHLGKPIVATKVAGNEELLEKGTFGLLCHPDKDALSEAILRMIGDPELRKRYAQLSGKRSVQILHQANRYGLEDFLLKY